LLPGVLEHLVRVEGIVVGEQPPTLVQGAGRSAPHPLGGALDADRAAWQRSAQAVTGPGVARPAGKITITRLLSVIRRGGTGGHGSTMASTGSAGPRPGPGREGPPVANFCGQDHRASGGVARPIAAAVRCGGCVPTLRSALPSARKGRDGGIRG